jgi:hypothetical protein
LTSLTTLVLVYYGAFEAIANPLQTTDLVKIDPTKLAKKGVSHGVIESAHDEIRTIIENCVEFAKTKPQDAIVILVGGGSTILPRKLKGVSKLILPPNFMVANAVGAAV